MRPDDGQTQTLGQLGRTTRVVDVCMGDPNLHQGHAQLYASALQHVKVATWVDDGGGHALVFPDHRAVLLKWRDGDSFVVKHKKVLIRIPQIINWQNIHQTDTKLY